MVPSRWGTVSLRARALRFTAVFSRGLDADVFLCVCRSTSATIPTRHNRATAAVSSCRQRARCRWSCPLTAFLRGVGLRQSVLFSLVLEEVDNTQRTQSLHTVSRRGKRNYRTGLMFLSPNVYIKQLECRGSSCWLTRAAQQRASAVFLFFYLGSAMPAWVGGFLLSFHHEIKALA